MKQDQYATNAEGQFFRVSRKSDTRPLNGRLNLSEGYTPEASGGRVQESSMAVAPDLFTACAVEFLRSEGYVVMPPVEEHMPVEFWEAQTKRASENVEHWDEQAKSQIRNAECTAAWGEFSAYAYKDEGYWRDQAADSASLAKCWREVAAFTAARAESLRAKKEAGQ
ncbi:hypothetical protein ACUH96_00830 [Dermabacteraceae bacterium P13077]